MVSILVFYSGSSDKKAGKGIGELLIDGDDFSELENIKNWRRVLSNFHYEPFIWENKEWSCIEEAFQAAKFGSENYDTFQIAVRNKSKNLKEDAGKVSQSLRKWKKLTDDQLKEWDDKKYKIMKDISIAKYNQSEIGRKVLKFTKNATLMHSLVRKSNKLHFKHLEEIRSTLL